MVSVSEYLAVAAIAFVAATIGGVAGYGTGLLLPPILLPIVGPEAVVPIISLSALATNASRAAAFRDNIDLRIVMKVFVAAFPSCVIGAFLYTRFSGDLITLIIGAMLLIIVPIRRHLARQHWSLAGVGLLSASAFYGFLVGITSGSGVVLLSILMAAGLSGPFVIATDAGISLLLGVSKSIVYQSAGALPPSAWLMAAVIGASSTPGAFFAKRLTRRLSTAIHTWILDGVVMLGGLLLILQVWLD